MLSLIVCTQGYAQSFSISDLESEFVPLRETLSNPDPNDNYYFDNVSIANYSVTRAEQLQLQGSAISEVVDPLAAVESNFRPAYVFPSPFVLREGAHLGYDLAESMDIQLRIYNAMGHELVRRDYAAGEEGGKGNNDPRFSNKGTVGLTNTAYNKIPLNYELFNYNLSAGIYFFVLLNDGNVVYKGKFAIKPE